MGDEVATRTFATLIAEARTLLSDKIPTSGGAYRYTDAEMMESVNGAISELRTRRPDLFLPLGLRVPVPFYTVADVGADFPLDVSVYTPMVWYLAGRAEAREDTWGNDGRAAT